MKKKILFIAVMALLTVGFASCEKESLGKTQITYYAEIQLEGESQMIIDKGSTYVEPGFTATMAGKDVSDQVTVTGDVDTSASGVYTISYSVVNADGFVASASRTVVVLDPADPIEGFWQLDASVSTRDYNGTVASYKGNFQILFLSEGAGTYFVDDLFAGWYAQGAGYGTAYAMQAEITIAADGTITLEYSYVPGWGDSADYLNAGVYDAANKQITYKVGYAGIMEFDVTLNKVE
ncbi:MAG: DUF5012 domain-containing protein [Paludibacteraceae bacterium]|nr:DUF5012 domain-containing protein [Paludibacteraceae bacterium]